MCGRVIQSSEPLRYAIVDGLDVRDGRLFNYRRRWNGAPSQELLVIRENHKTGERSLDLLRWGLIPYWRQDPTGGRKPINAKSETVARLPIFREAYQKRRCILPVDGFYEWRATKLGRDIGCQGNLLQDSFIVVVCRIDPPPPFSSNKCHRRREHWEVGAS
jgi:putative SOS response-associated peptidase YedK